MDWSLSKLIRIESGTVGISINDLRALLQLYRIDDQGRVNDLIAMARAAKEPAWWSPYREFVSAEFAAFLSYESAATIVRNFEPVLMPGLLQTEEYARAALAEMAPRATRADVGILGQVDNLVELRMERQDRLVQRSEPVKVFFAFDQAALYRWVGGPDVMRRQLERIKDALVAPNSTIWIVPYSAGLYQRMRGSYLLFELPTSDGNEDILYIEDFRGEYLIRDDFQDTAAYLEAFWKIEQIASKNEVAIDLVDEAIASLVRRG